MTTQSIARSWEFEQLTRLYQQRPEFVQAALQRLLAEDSELRWSIAVGAYLDRQINLGKAAELLNLHELELRERFIELGIPLRLGPADLDEARAEVSVARQQFTKSAEDAD